MATKAEKVQKVAASTPAEVDPTAELVARIEKLEKNQSIIKDAFAFAANQVRPLFGFAPLALVFDAISEKLDK